MFAVGIVSALYYMVNPIIVAGIVVIVIAVIGLIAYMRGKK
jgi:lipopolysaccharide export LptBFGC system permease protein LptF